MRFVVEAIFGLALILMAQNTVVKAHNWLRAEVVRHIVERELYSMVRFTEALTNRSSYKSNYSE